jgi:hypothetical protein
MRITNPLYLWFGMPYGTSRTADFIAKRGLGAKFYNKTGSPQKWLQFKKVF